MHIPDDIMSNIYPRLLSTLYSAKKFMFASIKENNAGYKNQVKTLFILKS
jgi:hypothetical protein